jgi:hypothetical protein
LGKYIYLNKEWFYCCSPSHSHALRPFATYTTDPVNMSGWNIIQFKEMKYTKMYIFYRTKGNLILIFIYMALLLVYYKLHVNLALTDYLQHRLYKYVIGIFEMKKN